MLRDEATSGVDGEMGAKLALALGLSQNLNASWTDRDMARLPFIPSDATAGSESELQVAVIGPPDKVDLALTIRASSFYENQIRRAATGDTSGRILRELEDYLRADESGVWENSWVRFPLDRLNTQAQQILESDLRADKSDPHSPRRQDSADFFLEHQGETWLRVPISYLLKLALADLAGSVSEPVRGQLEPLLEHFLNDNTSPETYSFYAAPMNILFQGGRGVAKETSQRFLLSQLLLDHANERFGLLEHGQRAVIYFAPLPPSRQRRLNELIPDAHYRSLFMNPCLSGWDRGEIKKEYMGLCHSVLSRSQLNALAKLREAGLLSTNLVALPNTSNTCLANNGTHVSLGSKVLGKLLGHGEKYPGMAEEKYMGDLVIKVVEHFLPLFVNTCSAAPLRMDFEDFHPERALGFLPHELDYTHLRMIWRRWKKKAKLKICGRPLTPFGPPLLDRSIARLFGLRGDFIPDFRLLDYMTTLMSTHRCPALNGELGNDVRLKKDLEALGVFHESMSTYLLYKQRQLHVMGFSGFEARFYSLFDSLTEDMHLAVDLQQLLTSLACKLILSGHLTHAHIPDTPEVESERRQIFFATAIALPTFFLRKESTNHFLRELVKNVSNVRASHRYPGYLRVHVHEYRLALLDYIQREHADLVEACQAQNLLREARERILNPALSAGGKLTRRILNQTGARSPLNLRAREFNMAAEEVYREPLRQDYLREGLNFLLEDCEVVRNFGCLPDRFCRQGLAALLNGQDIMDFMRQAQAELRDSGGLSHSRPILIQLLALVIGMHREGAKRQQ